MASTDAPLSAPTLNSDLLYLKGYSALVNDHHCAEDLEPAKAKFLNVLNAIKHEIQHRLNGKDNASEDCKGNE